MPLPNMNVQLYCRQMHLYIFPPTKVAQTQCTKQSDPLICLICDWASQLLQTTPINATTLRQGNTHARAHKRTQPITRNNVDSPRLTHHVLNKKVVLERQEKAKREVRKREKRVQMSRNVNYSHVTTGPLHITA